MVAGRTWGYAAWAWVIVFIAFHIYWYAGGRIGHPNDPPKPALDLFNAVVVALFLAGAVVPLAAVSGWGRRLPRGLLRWALWTACAILTLRGLVGVIDELLRVTGLAPGGLTGLTREQVTGSANPSAAVLWWGRAIDAFFVLGGILFGRAAVAFHRGTVAQRPRDQA